MKILYECDINERRWYLAMVLIMTGLFVNNDRIYLSISVDRKFRSKSLYYNDSHDVQR